MALRLAYRLALAGLRQEQRKHVVHSSEHRGVPLLTPGSVRDMLRAEGVEDRVGYFGRRVTLADVVDEFHNDSGLNAGLATVQA